MLAETGRAGAPASLFYETSLKGWAEDMEVPYRPEDPVALCHAVFDVARRKGRGAGDVFALRQQRPSFPFLLEQLGQVFPDQPDDLSRLIRAFGPLKLIHLTRQDKLAQAVSLIRAEISGLWHQNADGSEYERNPPRRADGFDADQIAAMRDRLVAYDQDWRAWFRSVGVDPLTLTYEDVSADPKGQLMRVLTFLDLDPAVADGLTIPLRKLADETSQAWIARMSGLFGPNPSKDKTP